MLKSIKAKLILVTCGLFLALFLLQTIPTIAYLQNKNFDTLKTEQFQRTCSMANEIDTKLQQAHLALQAVAKIFPIEQLGNVEKVQSWLNNRRGIASIFDNGLYLFNPQGLLYVERPFIEGRRGRDYSFRPYYQQTVANNRPFISDPYTSSKHSHPSIMMTAPIYDQQGQLVIILAGSLDLLKDNFLGSLTQERLGENGNFFLAGLDRTVIVHHDDLRIMKKDVPIGVNQLFDRAMEGFEGTEKTINSRGIAVLSSFKQVNSKPWVLGASRPLDEVYASTKRVKDVLWVFMGGSTVVIMMIMLMLLRHLVQPLLQFTQHIKTLEHQQGAQRLFPYPHENEIGYLVKAFNQMVIQTDKAQQALLESEQDLAQAQRVAQVGNWLWDIEATTSRWSDELYRIFGLDKSQSLIPFRAFYSRIHSEDRYQFKTSIKKALRDKAPQNLLYRILHKDGCCRHVQQQIKVSLNGNGDVVQILGTVQDVTERINAQRKLEKLATRDPLTNLYNRRRFLEFSQELIYQAQRNDHGLCMIMFDLDHFKQVNDSYGHLAGDEVLRAISQLALNQKRSGDICGRYGGEEFCMLLADTNLQGASIIAERLRQTIELLSIPLPKRDNQAAETIHVTASFGVAQWKNGWDTDALTHVADQALYQAKASGRNCVIEKGA